MAKIIIWLAFLLIGSVFCIELPVGLRPAKALGEPERTIVPGPEHESVSLLIFAIYIK